MRNSSAGGSYRRRSSSEDNGRGARESQPPPHALTNSYTSPAKDGRKGSVVEAPPLRTVQEDGHVDVGASKKEGLASVLNADERSDESEKVAQAFANHNVGFDSALGQSTEVCETTSAAAIDLIAHRGEDGQVRLERTAPANVIGLGLGLDLPTSSLNDNNRPHSQGQISTRTKPRPNLRIAILDQNKEVKPTPPPKSARHLREDSVASSLNGSMYSQSLLQDVSTPRDIRVASVALKQSIVPVSAAFKVRELNVARSRSSEQFPQSIAPEGRPRSRNESQPVDNNATAQVPPKNATALRPDLPTLTSRFSRRAATPEPYVRAATPEHSAQYATRPSTAQPSATTSTGGSSTFDHLGPSQAATPVTAGKGALATARAKAAALSNIEVPTWNASFYEQTKTPGSDLGSLPSAPLHGSVSDPVQTLAKLAEQCEALHARHATLRAQRQQLSSGIIANLKDQRPGSDYGDMLLHEQLSLAAVSSSIDICFAKLKSLECQREDAIATLVAQATAASRATEQMASASRKSSLAPSLESTNRLTTGRSTPDLHALYRHNRPGPIKTYAYRGDAETQRTRSPLYPQRQASLLHETGTDSTTPLASNPKRLTQIREPPYTSQSSIDTTGTSSTIDDADDTQPSDFSDIEDMLAEEGLRQHSKNRTDANGNSVKAVKVLGIGLEDSPITPPPVSPLSILSGAMRKKAKVPPHLRLHLDAQSQAEADNVSPLTSSTLRTEDSDQLARELELQLQSFPSAPGRHVAAMPPSTTTASTTDASSVTSSGGGKGGMKKKGRRNDDVPSPVVVQRSDTGKSHASAHTINVYYDYGREAMPGIP